MEMAHFRITERLVSHKHQLVLGALNFAVPDLDLQQVATRRMTVSQAVCVLLNKSKRNHGRGTHLAFKSPTQNLVQKGVCGQTHEKPMVDGAIFTADLRHGVRGWSSLQLRHRAPAAWAARPLGDSDGGAAGRGRGAGNLAAGVLQKQGSLHYAPEHCNL